MRVARSSRLPSQAVSRFSKQGDLLATGGEGDKTMRLWHYPSMAEHTMLGAHKKPITSADFSLDGSMVGGPAFVLSMRLGF